MVLYDFVKSLIIYYTSIYDFIHDNSPRERIDNKLGFNDDNSI
jgi:hypothetical protein